jgi:hypothetical protein
MARHVAAIVAAIVLAGCATQVSPQLVIERRPKDITSADIQSLLALARRKIYSTPTIPPTGPIYRVRFVSRTRAQVWYGHPNFNSKVYMYFDRTKGGWETAGGGGTWHPKT